MALTYREALDHVRAIAQQLSILPWSKVCFYAQDSASLVLTLIACDVLGMEACVLNRQADPETALELANHLGADLLVTDAPNQLRSFRHVADLSALIAPGFQAESSALFDDLVESSDAGHLIVMTTGTTGTPKAVLYDWSRLLKQVRLAPGTEDARWLLVYPLNHFAGIQLLSHCLVNGNTLVIPQSRQFADVISSINRYCVNSISATPTFWRMFIGHLAADGAKRPELCRITLGGEASTMDILAKLRDMFPDAAISHVYATTELGACFSVKDGLPGFPREYLERNVGNVSLKLFDDELFVRSENRMIGYLDTSEKPTSEGEWIGTGDLVAISGNRVLFVGRKTESINVGGVKVHPLKVEEVILETSGVRAARVYGKSNPVTGQIVAADIELEATADRDTVLAEISKVTRLKLNRYEQPRAVCVVNSLPKQNEKIVRRSTNA